VFLQKYLVYCPRGSHCKWTNCFVFLLQEDLDDAHLEALDRTFEEVYMAKYPVVGYMKNLVDSMSSARQGDEF
jgi:hypothetical protein